MASPGAELSTLDFASLIGSPLSAVIEAQAQAADATAAYIQEVGFHEDGSGARTVDFSYTRPIDNGDGTESTQAYTLQVPLLTMVPIPYIRIEEATIDFNAKIVTSQEMKTTLTGESEGTASYKSGAWSRKVKMTATASTKSSTSASGSKERTYTMEVHVRAVAAELPAGTDRLLSILEGAITEVPAEQSTEEAPESDDAVDPSEPVA